jgi:3-mercaptopyruvate sulfurtransferase SseA
MVSPELLFGLGYKNVNALKGGWKEWIKKDFATESK